MVALAANLLVLGFYKYQGFLAENVNRALGEESIAELDLALPIGISFFTLQAITCHTRCTSACTSPCSRS